jgi:hypothetical protein
MSDGLPIQCQPKLPMRRPKIAKTNPNKEVCTNITTLGNKTIDILQSIQIGSTTITSITINNSGMKPGMSIVNVTKLPVAPQSVVSILDSDGSDRDEAEGDEEELVNSEEDDEESTLSLKQSDPLSSSTLDIATSSTADSKEEILTSSQISEPDSTTAVSASDQSSGEQATDEQNVKVASAEVSGQEVEQTKETPAENSTELSDVPIAQDDTEKTTSQEEDENKATKTEPKEAEPNVPIKQ